jgi:hypothetical protein
MVLLERDWRRGTKSAYKNNMKYLKRKLKPIPEPKASIQHTKGSRLIDPNANLVSVVVRFDTTDNDKDDDTVLSVYLKNQAGVVIAQATGITGHWDDWSTNYVNLFIVLQSTRQQLAGTSIIEVHIEPNGNDTWDFNCSAVISFTDGIQSQPVFNNHWLSQDNKTNDFPFQIAQ